MSTEIGPLPSWVPGERPLTSADRAVGEHLRSVVATEGSDWILDGVAGCGTDQDPTSFFAAHQLNQPARSSSFPKPTREASSSVRQRRPAPWADNCRTGAVGCCRAAPTRLLLGAHASR